MHLHEKGSGRGHSRCRPHVQTAWRAALCVTSITSASVLFLDRHDGLASNSVFEFRKAIGINIISETSLHECHVRQFAPNCGKKALRSNHNSSLHRVVLFGAINSLLSEERVDPEAIGKQNEGKQTSISVPHTSFNFSRGAAFAMSRSPSAIVVSSRPRRQLPHTHLPTRWTSKGGRLLKSLQCRLGRILESHSLLAQDFFSGQEATDRPSPNAICRSPHHQTHVFF